MVILRIGAAVCGALAGGFSSAQAQGTATVWGIVTDAVSRLPIEGATVSVGSVHVGTDSSGAFEINPLMGHVRIAVSRRGYLTQPANFEMEVAVGDSIRRDLVLKPEPRISGTISDAETGERVHGCIVFATRRIMSMGEAWYANAGIPTADSRDGTFATVGLEPGDYVLEVTGCAWSWYPGVSRIEMATPITVTEAGIDALSIRLKTHDAHKISGIADHGAVDIRLVRHLQDVAQEIVQVRADASGRFKFDGVPEGEFHLVTSASADEVVTITDHDVEDVKLKGRPPIKMYLSQMRVDDGDATSTSQGQLEPVFDGEPGDYWPHFTGLGPDYGVASVVANNVMLPNGSIKIDGVPPELTFLITSHFGTLTGSGVAPRAIVVAIREPFVEYMDQTAQPRTTASEAGTFTLKKLVPGKYRIFTLTGDEQLLERNEKFLRTKAAAAESVEVTADSSVRIDLK